MAATFRTRPWLLASAARPAASPAFNTSRSLLANLQQSRQAASRTKRLPPSFRASIKFTKKQQSSQEATSSLAEDMLNEQMTMNEAGTAILAPRTLVPLHPSKIEGWGRLFKYYKEVLFQRVIDRAQIFAQTWQLKPKWFSRATFRAERKGVVEAALDLHAEMSRCLAKGGVAEKARLAKICVPKLHRSLVAAIEARPRGKSYTWERIALEGKPSWPRLVDHKWTEIDVGLQQSFRQAVVGIKSRQRLTELGANGKKLVSREREVMEYVVLWRPVDKAKRTQGDWRIYGTLKETGYEDVFKEKRMVKTMGALMARQQVLEKERQLKSS